MPSHRPPPVPIPDTHDPQEPAIRQLLDDPDRLAISDRTRPRALRLIQSLADEARRRGHEFLSSPDAHSTFGIRIGEDVLAFALTEEQDKTLQVPPEKVAAAKYSWQRVGPQTVAVASGRLALELVYGRQRQRWADRTRWQLEDKFSAALALGEQWAANAARQRAAAADERARLHALWKQAVPHAHDRYTYDVNVKRLRSQIEASAQAVEVRAYGQQLAIRAASELDPALRRAIEKWADWARAYAEAIDPLSRVEGLRHVDVVQPSPDDLDRYMPAGMTVRHSPGHDH